jgi:cag pathogenicity island protein 24
LRSLPERIFFMKYIRLTKEQFEELHEEFARFLATQSITADEWRQLKKNKPEVAEEELDIFSDLVWEGILQKTEYLEKIDSASLYLFKIADDEMMLIAIKVNDPSIDITTDEGFEWLLKNYLDESVDFFEATQPYTEDKNADIFNLVKMGSVISNGEWYRYFYELLYAE